MEKEGNDDGLSPSKVAAVFSLDADPLASDDEERHLHGKSSFGGDGLVNVVGGIALNTIRGVSDEHGDGGRKFDGSNGAVSEDDVVFLTFDQELLHGGDDVIANKHVLKGFRMEEVVAVAINVAEFMRFALKIDAVERLVGGQAQIVYTTGGKTLDGHLHVGRHAWWRLMLHVGDDADVVVVPDGLSAAEVDYRCGSHGSVVSSQFGVNCKRGYRCGGGSCPRSQPSDRGNGLVAFARKCRNQRLL